VKKHALSVAVRAIVVVVNATDVVAMERSKRQVAHVDADSNVR